MDGRSLWLLTPRIKMIAKAANNSETCKQRDLQTTARPASNVEANAENYNVTPRSTLMKIRRLGNNYRVIVVEIRSEKNGLLGYQ